MPIRLLSLYLVGLAVCCCGSESSDTPAEVPGASDGPSGVGPAPAASTTVGGDDSGGAGSGQGGASGSDPAGSNSGGSSGTVPGAGGVGGGGSAPETAGGGNPGIGGTNGAAGMSGGGTGGNAEAAGGMAGAGTAGATGAAGSGNISGGGSGGVGGTGGAAGESSGGSAGSGDEVSPAGDLDGFRFECPCLPGEENHSGDGNCEVAPETDRQTYVKTMGGDPNTIYNVTFRVRGLTEPNTYVQGTLEGERLYIGGSTSTAGYTSYMMSVADPMQHYFFNYNPTTSHMHFILDYEVTVPIRGGTEVTFDVDGDGSVPDGHQVANFDELVVPDVPPAPDWYDGQFVQLDVVSVEVAQ